MNQLERLEQSFATEPAPFFEIGDTVRVKVRVFEARASGKKKLQEELPDIFSRKRDKDSKSQEELENELYRQIGQLKVEIDWLKKKL